MGQVDRSFKERRDIVDLLERLHKDNITIGEMDEIGASLRKAEGRALRPLVRRLWREKSGDLLSRYAYLLDFFDDGGWLEQLIRITLTREDLEEEGKSVLLGALENCGIDITSPPFSRLAEEVAGPLRVTLPRLLEKGEPGLVLFMDDFVQYPEEMQTVLIREVGRVDHPGVIDLLDILAGYDSHEVASSALEALGKIRSPEAAAILARFGSRGTPELREKAQRNQRRLSFLGVSPHPEKASHAPISEAFAGAFDGAGNRSLWISRCPATGMRELLFLHLHEESGLVDAIGYGELSEAEYASILEEVTEEERLVPVSSEYAVALLRDALERNRSQQIPLPPEFYVRRRIFGDSGLVPELYAPPTPMRHTGSDISHLVAESPILFEEVYFSDWFLADPQVYDLADEWRQLDHRNESQRNSREARRLVERFCTEILAPRTQALASRVLLTVDLMVRSGAPVELVRMAEAVYGTISGGVPPRVHPFLRRLALESLDAAAEALAEGYDLRTEDGFEE